MGFLTDHSTRVEPVLQNTGQPICRLLTFSTGAYRHEGATTPKPIAACVEFFANFSERVLIGQQQIPGGAPHFELLRVRFNPAVIASGTGLVDLFRFLFAVDIASWCFANKAAGPQLGVQSTGHSLTEFNGLASRQGKGQADQNTVIRVNRIEVRIVSKPDCNAQIMQSINGDQRFSIVASETLGIFYRDMDADYLLAAWQDVIVDTVRTLRQERASEHFRNVLGQLIGSGQAVLDDDMRHPREHAPGTTVVGYRDEGFVYILPDVALREVNKIQPLKFTAYAIGSQLREDGLLIPGKANLSVQKSVRGSVIRLWRLKSEVLGCEGCEGCEDSD